MDSLLILILLFCGLALLSSVLSLIHMVRLNRTYRLYSGQSVPAALVRVEKSRAGKGGLLPTWSGVYAYQTEDGPKEFPSVNCYGGKKDVPQEISVIPLAGGGVLEHWSVSRHFCRRILPTWAALGAFAAYLLLYRAGQG